MVNLAPAPAPDDVPVTFVNVALPVEVPDVMLTVFTGLLFKEGLTVPKSGIVIPCAKTNELADVVCDIIDAVAIPEVAPSKISPSREVTVMVRLLAGVEPPREAPGMVIVSFTA